ncbi:MAG TPA: nucleotidyltransferase domain-containing protein [Chitinispirillaceae bacterium]|jgi:predicted nucleotidyltransferase|nr:nucleotidyltransferase domain-containing protein [Fibrobacter sp.]HLV33061.1 nucleotidyltransferase domain-containing protein [Chitinispirillaceae bacterium]
MSGLSDATIKKIQVIFSNYPSIDKVVLYGSRAKGTHKPGSDIDLVLYGTHLTLKTVYAIMEDIEHLYLPYKFDITIYSSIDNPKLLEHINRAGKLFYRK